MITIVLREKIMGTPIPFVWVHLLNENQSFADDTDIKGYANIQGVPRAKYVIKIRSPDHRPYTKSHHLNPNSKLTIKLDKSY